MATDDWYRQMSEKARQSAGYVPCHETAAELKERWNQEERQRHEASLCARCGEPMDDYIDKDRGAHLKAADKSIKAHLRCCVPGDVFVVLCATAAGL